MLIPVLRITFVFCCFDARAGNVLWWRVYWRKLSVEEDFHRGDDCCRQVLSLFEICCSFTFWPWPQDASRWWKHFGQPIYYTLHRQDNVSGLSPISVTIRHPKLLTCSWQMADPLHPTDPAFETVGSWWQHLSIPVSLNPRFESLQPPLCGLGHRHLRADDPRKRGQMRAENATSVWIAIMCAPLQITCSIPAISD